MPIITINNQEITVDKNSTVLDAAKMLNIHIPTLCYLNGYEHYTSCMICVVYDVKSDKLIPACSVMVEQGMHIETENEKVIKARKDTLDILLSEHIGDCEAMCQRACPAHMNIPLMIRQIKQKNYKEAIITVKKDIALPAVLGRICPAPCENGCTRKLYDHPLSICKLKQFVADTDLAEKEPYKPKVKTKSGKKVAVVGAGPTGLSAAYYLLQDGHECYIYDRNSLPGGMLRYGVTDKDLEKSVLDAEIERIFELGAEFHKEKILGENINLDALQETYDAVVLATGTFDNKMLKKI